MFRAPELDRQLSELRRRMSAKIEEARTFMTLPAVDASPINSRDAMGSAQQAGASPKPLPRGASGVNHAAGPLLQGRIASRGLLRRAPVGRGRWIESWQCDRRRWRRERRLVLACRSTMR